MYQHDLSSAERIWEDDDEKIAREKENVRNQYLDALFTCRQIKDAEVRQAAEKALANFKLSPTEFEQRNKTSAEKAFAAQTPVDLRKPIAPNAPSNGADPKSDENAQKGDIRRNQGIDPAGSSGVKSGAGKK